MSRFKTSLPAVFLVTLGCLTMAGDLASSKSIKGLGLASHASPAPKVFTSHGGFETFSSNFQLSWTDLEGQDHQTTLSRDQYKNLTGPYNRRNAYGAAISYGPVLSANPDTAKMLESVSEYAFCGRGNLIEALVGSEVASNSSVSISILPNPSQAEVLKAGGWQLKFKTKCDAKEGKA